MKRVKLKNINCYFSSLLKSMPNMPMCCLVRNGHYKQYDHNDNTKEKITKFYYGILYNIITFLMLVLFSKLLLYSNSTIVVF